MASIYKPTPLPELELLESPNQSPRVFSEVRLVIVHTPEGSYDGTLSWLRNPAAEVSYHVLIRKDGKRGVQLVKWSRKAWHAKVFNEGSVSISLDGWAKSTRALSPVGRAGARAVAYLLKSQGLPPRWSRNGGGEGFCRHADIQRDRSDPMSLGRWLTFVALVKWEYRRGKFRDSWGWR